MIEALKNIAMYPFTVFEIEGHGEMVPYENADCLRAMAKEAIAGAVGLIAQLQAGDFVRQLRLDASGEAGRMSSTEMYRLADLLAALVTPQSMKSGD